MIKTIFFDLDDTILDFKLSERIALKSTFRELGIEPDDKMLQRYSVINLSQWKRLERKEISRQQVKVGRYRLLFDEYGIDASPELATSIYENKLACGSYFLDGSKEMLNTLYGSYDMYLVSNGSKRVQDGRLSKSGITHMFKNIFISETVGYEKPAKEFFDYCFDSIGSFDKNTAVIVGDSLTSDIQGGINAGIKTIWFNSGRVHNDSQIQPDFEAYTYNDIINIIKSL